MKDLESKSRKWVRARVLLLALFLSGFAGAIARRAYHLQIAENAMLSREAGEQQLRDVHISPKRGTIFDRNGAELAVSVDAPSIYANPRAMRARGVDPGAAATQLSSVLGVDRQRLFERLSSDRFFVWIERQVTPEESEAVRNLAIAGVEITREAHRFYPNGDLASHVLGFANIDGAGIEGVELSMESRLHGSTEVVPATVDRRGRVVFSEHLLDDRAAQGDDVYLTIDKTLQHIAERELTLTARTFEAQSGSVVVMDPRNGEVLAMANYPAFDPNRPRDYPVSSRRNRAVTDRFEPGSTIKPFTVAAALAAGTLGPSERIDCNGDQSDGRRLVVDEDGHTIGEAGHHRPFGDMTPAQVLAHSSNIGAARVGIELGRPLLYRGLRRFGFGETTGIPLPGETAGILRHHHRWYAMDLATIAFGQGLSVTTLQMATAYSALANGGRLLRPTLVRRVVDARGEVALASRTEVRRQVVPRGTARLVADMLTGVTGEDGTGVEAAIDGYLVAGKTGTAQKAHQDRSGYDDTRWIASFVGFVPADSPRLVIAVVIDEPAIDHYGGVVAGPVFRRVGAAAMRHLGVPASTGGDALVELGRRRRQAELAERRARREARRLARQSGAVVEEAVEERESEALEVLSEGTVRVPELGGASARRALVTLFEAGLSPKIEGTGVVALCTPGAGEVVPRGTEVRVVLENPTWSPFGPSDGLEAEVESSESALASARVTP